MTELIIPSEAPALSELKEGKLDHFARKAVLSLLKKLKHGRITLIEDNHRYPFGDESHTAALQAFVTVYHSQFYSRILFGGSIGAAEAYMEGLWSADDLTMVMRILALNQKAFENMEKGLGIMPDYEVQNSIDDIINKRDRVLEKAVEVILR